MSSKAEPLVFGWRFKTRPTRRVCGKYPLPRLPKVHLSLAEFLSREPYLYRAAMCGMTGDKRDTVGVDLDGSAVDVCSHCVGRVKSRVKKWVEIGRLTGLLQYRIKEDEA